MHYFLAIVASVGFLVLAGATDEETTCQSHRRNAGGDGALMHWDIKCDDDGNYLPLQCTVETPKWCRCYHADGPVEEGGGPSRSIKTCSCILARDEAKENNARECDIPTCKTDGGFQKMQCCATTNKCHCVNPETGERQGQDFSTGSQQCQ